MKQYLTALLIGFSILSMFSCKKDAAGPASTQHDVSSVAGPSSGSINTAVKLTVTYPYSNGCDYIGSFDKTVSGSIVFIKAYSKQVPKESICTQDAGSRTIEYDFTSGSTGTFELRFMKRDGSFISHTIVVQ
jgi:hypothetical protein